MNAEAYNDWVSIFNEEFKNVWEQERTELRKMSMIYFAFQKELDKLKSDLSEEVSTIKLEFKKKDFAEKRKKFSGLAQSEKFDIDILGKENQTPSIVPLKQDFIDVKTEDFFIESPNTRPFVKDYTPQPSSTPLTANSPILNKNSFNAKRKKSTSPASLNHQNIKTSKIKQPVKMLTTPNNPDDSNIMECSIIEDTPDLKVQKNSKKSRLKLKRPENSKLNKSKPTTTLTQMFFESKKTRHIDSNLPSMTATELINLINESSESGAESDATVDDLQVPTPAKNHQNNVIRAESPNKLSNQYAYQEVVRGKERQKLKGWSCNECKDYYEGLELSPDELQKKKDQCSRHRNRFQPREETWDGFWDLSFGPTPRPQDEEESLVLFKL